MLCFLTGASGFLGGQLIPALLAAGHHVVGAVRNPAAAMVCHPPHPRLRFIAADFARDTQASAWLERVKGADVVINAVGIIRETPAQSFDTIHVKAPRALFAACAQAGVGRVIQISALGAAVGAHSRYQLSKRAADNFLCSLPLKSAIVQPSLVFGEHGASARLFTMLASLPVIALPGDGGQLVQPVHIDDVCAAIVALLDAPLAPCTRLALVGPRELTLRDFLAVLRSALGMPAARFVPVPLPLVRLAARAGGFLRSSLLDRETLQMLERGNTGDAAPVSTLLGHAPKPPEQFIARSSVPAMRVRAQLGWLLPMLRTSIALVWIVTGIVSAGLFPTTESYVLLARVGITGAMAPVMLYGAALLDVAFGIGILLLRRRRWLWLAQGAVILFYSAIISWKLPEFWLHPYGPLLKNLPMLAAIWLLLEMERPPWTT